MISQSIRLTIIIFLVFSLSKINSAFANDYLNVSNSFECQVINTSIYVNSNFKIDDYTYSNINFAPVLGSKAFWQLNESKIDNNDFSNTDKKCNDSDNDGFTGLLSIENIDIENQKECDISSADLNKKQSFSPTLSSLNLFELKSRKSCNFTINKLNISQIVQANQPVGKYSIDMNFTVIAD